MLSHPPETNSVSLSGWNVMAKTRELCPSIAVLVELKESFHKDTSSQSMSAKKRDGETGYYLRVGTWPCRSVFSAGCWDHTDGWLNQSHRSLLVHRMEKRTDRGSASALLLHFFRYSSLPSAATHTAGPTHTSTSQTHWHLKYREKAYSTLILTENDSFRSLAPSSLPSTPIPWCYHHHHALQSGWYSQCDWLHCWDSTKCSTLYQGRNIQLFFSLQCFHSLQNS